VLDDAITRELETRRQKAGVTGDLEADIEFADLAEEAVELGQHRLGSCGRLLTKASDHVTHVSEGLSARALDGNEGIGGLVWSSVERLATGGSRGGDVLHLRVKILIEITSEAGAIGVNCKLGVSRPLLVQLDRLGPQSLEGDIASV
jgi:hypothetical protein